MIDIHIHIGKSPDGGECRICDIIKIQKNYSFSKIILFPIDDINRDENYIRLNNKVYNLSLKYDFILPCARLNLSHNKAADEFLRNYKKNIKFYKLHPRSENFSNKEFEKLLKNTKKEKLIFLIHTDHKKNTQPVLFEKSIKQNSDNIFILLHSGKDLYKQAISLANKYKNVYLETSTLSLNRTKNIIKNVSIKKILFGSDFPYSHPEIEIYKYKLLLKSKQLENILYKNFLKIYNSL